MQLGRRLAALERDLVFFAIAANVHDDALGKRVDDRDADAVQAAGHLVPAAAELATCVQDGEDDLDRGNLFLLVLFHRNAAPVVDNLDRVVGPDEHLNMVAISGERLVNRIVDDLVHQMMQAERAG